MCTSSYATEEKPSGGDNIDSAVLHIMIQHDNCICRVTIYNQVEPVYIGLEKYDRLTSSAPEENGCGLAVDITHIPEMSTESVIAPIECTENVNLRKISLPQSSTLEFISRIIDGTFIRGYCMRIIRGIVALERPY
jgi:hypothetical protein